jgi:hypothetical protein
VEPIAYHIAEVKERVILAGPTMDMVQDKWNFEVKPVFEASPYLSRLLPTSGRGSRGGISDEIRFTNGAVLKFMSAGGGDEKRSGFTARVVVITEVDKMDTAGMQSREADPIKQLEARTEHFDERKRIYLECTVSVEQGRIWQEYINGTQAVLMAPCPHCKSHISPERENFCGFEDCDNVIDAGLESSFHCPLCGEAISDKERRIMNLSAMPVYRGQSIENGVVVGDIPKTDTFSFRWSAFQNNFWSSLHIGKGEWQLKRAIDNDTDDVEDFEKRQTQFTWSKPFEPMDFNEFNLDATQVRRRVSHSLPREIIPNDVAVVRQECKRRFVKTTDDIMQLSVGVDIGKSTCWWFMLAGLEDGRLYVPSYGAFTGSDSHDANMELAVLNSLRVFRDEVIEPGFMINGTEDRMVPGQVLFDCGWLDNVICQFIRESGPLRGSRYRAAFGRGRSQVTARHYTHPAKKDQSIRDIGDQWSERYYTVEGKRIMKTMFNADHWKLWVQRALVAKPGEPGALTFYRASSKTASEHEHAKISRHLTNETLERVNKPGKGIVEEWVKKGQNHWLDAAAMAAVGLDRLGYSIG